MKVITIFIIIVFLLATGGIVVLYLAQPVPVAPTLEVTPPQEVEQVVEPVEENEAVVISGEVQVPAIQTGANE